MSFPGQRLHVNGGPGPTRPGWPSSQLGLIIINIPETTFSFRRHIFLTNAQGSALLGVLLDLVAELLNCRTAEIVNMSTTGTMRGTPSRTSGRGPMPSFTNSPASGIPRAVETHTRPALETETGGGSSVSTSRQKQSKKDEVRPSTALSGALRTPINVSLGYPKKDRGRP